MYVYIYAYIFIHIYVYIHTILTVVDFTLKVYYLIIRHSSS